MIPLKIFIENSLKQKVLRIYLSDFTDRRFYGDKDSVYMHRKLSKKPDG